MYLHLKADQIYSDIFGPLDTWHILFMAYGMCVTILHHLTHRTFPHSAHLGLYASLLAKRLKEKHTRLDLFMRRVFNMCLGLGTCPHQQHDFDSYQFRILGQVKLFFFLYSFQWWFFFLRSQTQDCTLIVLVSRI